MAATLNPADQTLAATSPRLITVSLANNLLFNGNVTGTVSGVAAVDIANAINNFNTSNDQNSSAVIAPTVAAGAITHTTNQDGAVNVKFTWSWSGTESTIDGFVIYAYSTTNSASYVIGTTVADEAVTVVPANKRSHTLYGVPAPNYYTFGVRAYRRVDTNVAAAGILFSAVAQSNVAGQNPYRPESQVNITVNNINDTPRANYLNSNVQLSGSNGTIQLTGGTGSVPGVVMPGNPINSTNVTTYISAGTITADRINVTNLSAINANLGTVTSGTINSGVVNAGDFAGYTWPTTGTATGAHIGPSGVLAGNGAIVGRGFFEFNAINGYFAVGRTGGQYIQLNTNGTFFINGDIVATNNVKPNAITLPASDAANFGGTPVSGWYGGPIISLNCIANQPVLAFGYWAPYFINPNPGTANPMQIHVSTSTVINSGTNMADSTVFPVAVGADGYYNSATLLGAYTPPADGVYYFRLQSGSNLHSGRIVLFQAKR